MLTAFLLASQAFALPNAMFDELLSFEGVLKLFDDHIEVYRQPLIDIAYGLSVVGFILAILDRVRRGNVNVIELFGTAIIAGTLLIATPTINTTTLGIWDEARVVATGYLKAEYTSAANAFDKIGQATVDVLVTSAIFSAVPDFAEERVAEQVTGWAAYQATRDRLAQITNIALPILMVAVLFIFFLLVMSGAAISLAGVMLPLGAGLLTFPGGIGASLLSNYVKVVLHAILVIILFPMMMGLIFDLTARRPAERLGINLEATQTNINQAINDIDADTGKLGLEKIEQDIADKQKSISAYKNDPNNRRSGFGAISVPFRPWAAGKQEGLTSLEKDLIGLKESRDNQLSTYRTNVTSHMTKGMENLNTDVNNWALSMFFMVTMLIIGTFALLKFEGYIAAMVGGLVLGAGVAMATLAYAAAAALGQGVGFPAIGGGGGGGKGESVGGRDPAPYSSGPSSKGGSLARYGGGSIVPSYGGGSSKGYAYAFVTRPELGGGGGPKAIGSGGRPALGNGGRPALPPPSTKN